MKIRILLLFPALIACVALILPDRVAAQTFTNLYSFTATQGASSTNSDGANPSSLGGLILSGNILYGMAFNGGPSGNGTVFAIHADGSGFTNLHGFSALQGSGPLTNGDGANPSGLVLSGDTLYGTASHGGSSGAGTVFAIHTNGSGFTNLYNFTTLASGFGAINSDGANPFGGFIVIGESLYGTADNGGAAGNGTVFTIHTDGTGFTNLHSFTSSDGFGANGLIASGNTLYGTMYTRGAYNWGTVFAIQTDGSEFTKLHDFTGIDGGASYSTLVLSGSTLYGTTSQGGFVDGVDTDEGTIFAVNTDGTGFTNLYSFTALTPPGYATNSDGRFPEAGLVLWGDVLYGTATEGGASGHGTVFAVHTDGSGFTNLHDFIGSDGDLPLTELILADNSLYGTAFQGGNSGNGTVFTLSLPRLSPLSDYNFALNGGFETGDFSHWQLYGNSFPDILIGTKPWYVHSGGYGAQPGPVGSLGYLSQTLPTYPGATYLLSFWLDSPDGETPNEFLASWNGVTLLDKTNLAAIGWTKFQFTVTATGINSVLQFGFRDDNTYLGLDDISVTRMVQPESAGISLSGTGLVFHWNNGLYGGTYQTLMSTNVALPLNKWMPVATNVLSADGNFSVAVLNAVNAGGSQRFYLLQLQ